MITAATLAHLAPFAGVAKPALEALAAQGLECRYRAGAVLFLSGSAPRGWYVVMQGKVRVVRGTGPRQHVIHTEGPGGTLGEVPLFAGGTHPATGIAAEPTMCVLFSLPALRAAMKVDETVAMVLLARLASRARNLVDRLDERSARGVRARLIEYLLLRAREAPREIFSLGMTQQALAEELGTVREVISRELRELNARGFVERIGTGRYRLRG